MSENYNKIDKNIKSLLNHFSEDWEKLLYCSYYQTDSPYEALYGNDLTSYLEQNNISKINELKNMLGNKKGGGNHIFKELFQSSIEKLGKLDKLEYWKNIVDYCIDHRDDNLLSIKNIEILYPKEKNHIEGIGITFGKLYEIYQEQNVINMINDFFNKDYSSDEKSSDIEDEYIELVNYLDEENIEHFGIITLENYNSLDLYKKIFNKVENDDTKLKFFKNEQNNIINNHLENMQQNIIEYYNNINDETEEDQDIISIFKLINYLLKNNILTVENTNKLIFQLQSYINKNPEIYKCLLTLYKLHYRNNIESTNIINNNVLLVYQNTIHYSILAESLNLLLIMDINKLDSIQDNFNYDKYIKELYNHFDNIGWNNFINNLNKSNSINLKIILYYYFIRDISIIKNNNILLNSLDFDSLIETYNDDSVYKYLKEYDVNEFKNYFSNFINFIFDHDNTLFMTYFDNLKDDVDSLYKILISYVEYKIKNNEDILKKLLDIYKSSNKYNNSIFDEESRGLLNLFIEQNKISCLEFDSLEFENKIIEYMELKKTDIIKKYINNKNKIFSKQARKLINNNLKNMIIEIDSNRSISEYITYWDEFKNRNIEIYPIVKKLCYILSTQTPEDDFKKIFEYLLKNKKYYKDILENINKKNLHQKYNEENVDDILKESYNNFINKITEN
ncbi:hypothetical protein NEI00_08665 [Brachyspira pilosicoli]|uniref:hypothetical protein n=1 Tax=Brachyspira pilosicoli TaxID=52584 RepID=UPI002542D2A0|nr:hypothetical protein [Brachyspira pilosicoli]WIH83071.1 hypothetical protein NEI00_08665 [Brachyspira pilosicoli]